MTPHIFYESERAVLWCGDAMQTLQGFDADSIGSIVTDPPAGISFMGKEWDHHKGGRDEWIAWMQTIASEAFRVLKPGGHALVWAIPRTSHWTATAWENAGFEVRDRIGHIFGSGFPKSLDVSKAIDKAAGVERELTRVGSVKRDGYGDDWDTGSSDNRPRYDIPATPEALRWEGWGTALKPAVEDWWLLRKPLSEKNVAANVLKWGTGGVNVDGCRVGIEKRENPAFGVDGWRKLEGREDRQEVQPQTVIGRYPSHLIHDGSDEVLAVFPETGGGNGKPVFNKASKHGDRAHAGYQRPNASMYTDDVEGGLRSLGDSGSAARFFYCAKPSKADRDAGCEEMEAHVGKRTQDGGDDTRGRPIPVNKNHHPTVKATRLMRYLCKLITPPGGVVLDCFAGSGSTGKAAVLEGFHFRGIELSPDYCEIAKRRIQSAEAQLQMDFGGGE